MEIDEARREYLIKKYRIPFFETKKRDIKEMKNLIPDEDLVDIININNEDMQTMIYSGNIDQEELTKLAYANVNFYIIANYRKISITGKNKLLFACSFINKKINNHHNSKLTSFAEEVINEGSIHK